MRICITLVFLFSIILLNAQENINKNKFRQLKQEFATPNIYRTASGAPGHEYWQQKADYKIDIRLNEQEQQLHGSETITYHNQSPDELSYIWMQLDQNIRAKNSDTYKIQTSSMRGRYSFSQLEAKKNNFDGGFKIQEVKGKKGEDLDYTINKTMMRIDLENPLKSGESITFSIKWWYNINNRLKIGGRSGYEFFEADSNCLYTIAQFYPRMAVYNEVEGWQNKQFLGTGEFSLPFGDFDVTITVPADHIVGATGELQNAKEVLSSKQLKKLETAKKSETPIIIVSQQEAEEAEKTRSSKYKTWNFKASNVRDFAFASSRKFIWDAMGVSFGDRTVLAMSYYPKEGNPLWEQYSTKVVAHTIKTYSNYTFDYPYPVAISVHSKSIGMEYPMICFNYGRPESDGTYSKNTKYGMIGVIIHEVGHNYFPMIVNSDERQWAWMDEGINSFLEFITKMEWEYDFPSRAGHPSKIVDYMRGDKKYISPIMTNSESVWNLGPNAYHKPATALNILRETIMGRELFDYAFKTYANRWKFKHPSPEDFFRTMEDASGVDLDWFWRGWFYTTDNVDISIENAKWFQIDNQDPQSKKELQKEEDKYKARSMTNIHNSEEMTVTYNDTTLQDFYNSYDQYKVSSNEEQSYENWISSLNDIEKEYWDGKYNYYQIDFKNIGGLVMPIILEFTFVDNSTEIVRIPAEIWRKNNEEVSKVFFFDKEVSKITLDPYLETADVDLYNNYWPRQFTPNRFQVYKQRKRSRTGSNIMQRELKRMEEENKKEN